MILLLLAPRIAVSEAGADIIRRVQEKYNSLKTLSIHFQMTMANATGDQLDQDEGWIFLNGQGDFCIETPTQRLIYDGQNFVNYSILEKQAIIYDGDEASSAVISPRTLFFEYPEKYRVVSVEKAKLADKPCDLLTLAPKEETDPTKQVQVWVDRQESLTRQFLVEDLMGNVTVFNFEQFNFNGKLPEDVFRFDPPGDVEVIHAR
ncbi:MAG: outer membrane lipoprotein carrier protein LolA [bacterium]